MRKTDVTQRAMFSYRSRRSGFLKSIRCKLHILVDGIVQSMNADSAPLYWRRGRPPIGPERWFRTSLIQTLFTIRFERQRVW